MVGREEKSLLCDPGSELRLGGREKKKKGEDNKWDEEKRGRKKVPLVYTHQVQSRQINTTAAVIRVFDY